MDAVKYLKEKVRMCERDRLIDCEHCPLSRYNNGTDSGCADFEEEHPAEAVRIVEEWSKAHPIQTNGQKFEEVFGINGKYLAAMFYDYCVNEERDGVAIKPACWWDMPYEAPKGAE